MDQVPEHAIAVIGMSGRFPEAGNIETFWKNICQSKESISTFSNEELTDAGAPEHQIQSAHYVKARGILERIEFFDADFFGISPLEAQLTDPQHRLFLECAYEALENAGCCPDFYPGSIGVYGGSARSTYFLYHILPHRHLMETMGDYMIRIGNESDFLTTKISYKLNLKGPSLSIQTACSTSLSAICVACNHLLSYQCDTALAGGASIYLPQKSGYVHQEGMIFSPDGHCRPFDTCAKGTVPSNGVAVVVLKRMEDALADRDHIYAIIRGYGMNNDGGDKISYSAPSVTGQVEAIESAIAMAEIDPATISYVEAHGTATLLGDPIEVEALTKVFRKYTQEQRFCAIGSVKSNIGHSMEAAGVAGFVKAVLTLQEKKIPPTLHFTALNPQISEDSPFYVNTSLKEWPAGISPRRTCVSSFGVGGTNAHIILEEAPKLPASIESTGPQLLVLSAKSSSALDKITLNLGNYLREHPEISLADVAFTLQMGRKVYKYRRAIACRTREEAVASLLGLDVGLRIPNTSLEKYIVEIGDAWSSGAIIDWTTFQRCLGVEGKSSRVPLPTYPFEKKRYWVDPLDKLGFEQSKPVSLNHEDFLLNTKMILAKIWKQFLGVEAISSNANFFALGGDSLLALQVISAIQEQLGFSLKLHTFYQFPTVNELAIQLSRQAIDESPLVLLKSGSESIPLFLVHGIDGNVFAYRSLAEEIKFRGPIFGLQANNSETQEQTIEEIASSYIRELQKIHPKGPYLLCGFSFGGIIAYEMARQFEKSGHEPKFLGIIDSVNPQHELVPLNNDSEMLSFLIDLLEGKELPIDFSPDLNSKNSAKRLLSCMGLNVLQEIQQQQIFEKVKQHLKSLKHYRPEPYQGKVVFFEAKERFFRMKDIPLSSTWQPLIKGEMDVHEIAGSHLNIFRVPFVENLASELSFSVNKALIK